MNEWHTVVKEVGRVPICINKMLVLDSVVFEKP